MSLAFTPTDTATTQMVRIISVWMATQTYDIVTTDEVMQRLKRFGSD
jgi:hypothetical protein